MAKTLLLADDSVTIQKVVGISFASEDIEITTVDNGDDAVARARETVPDIVLADAVMPGLSGYEVCEALKADPALAHIPVILLTGTFEAFDAERAERAGAAGHVSKPFEAQTLVDRVKDLLASAPPAVAEPPPEAAPERPASATAFDFTDDEDFAAPEADDGPAELEAESLDFDDSDAAFSFEEDDLAGALAAPLEPPPPAPDATQLMPPIPVPLEESAPAAQEPVGPGDLAQTTLLDPASASGYDVSSSDLGPRPGPGDPVLGPLSARSDEAGPYPTPRPYGATLEAEPAEEPAPVEAPARESASAELEVDSVPAEATPIEVAAVGEAAPIEEASPIELAEVESAAPPLIDAPEAEPEPLDVAEVGAITDPFPEEREPRADERGPLAAVAGSDPVAPDSPEAALDLAAEAAPTAEGETALTPELRRELSDTLEKIAWDAFGPVTEKIVSQALERIEQVVWEVVPQIAETLIQEEIRRLKDGGDAE